MAAARNPRPKNIDLAKRVCDLIRKSDHDRTFLPVELSTLSIYLKEELNNAWLFRLFNAIVDDCSILPVQVDCTSTLSLTNGTFTEGDLSSLEKIRQHNREIARSMAVLKYHTSRTKDDLAQEKKHCDEKTLNALLVPERVRSCEVSINKLLASFKSLKKLSVDVSSLSEKVIQDLSKVNFLQMLDQSDFTGRVATLSIINKCSMEEAAKKETSRLLCILNGLDDSIGKLESTLCTFLVKNRATWMDELKDMADEIAASNEALSIDSSSVKKCKLRVAEAEKAMQLLDPVTKRPQIARPDVWDAELSWWRSFLDSDRAY